MAVVVKLSELGIALHHQYTTAASPVPGVSRLNGQPHAHSGASVGTP